MVFTETDFRARRVDARMAHRRRADPPAPAPHTSALRPRRMWRSETRDIDDLNRTERVVRELVARRLARRRIPHNLLEAKTVRTLEEAVASFVDDDGDDDAGGNDAHRGADELRDGEVGREERELQELGWGLMSCEGQILLQMIDRCADHRRLALVRRRRWRRWRRWRRRRRRSRVSEEGWVVDHLFEICYTHTPSYE